MLANSQFTVQLHNQSIILHATLGAAKRIDQLVGGLAVAEYQCVRGSIESMAKVLVAGSGTDNISEADKTKAEALEQDVFKTGVAEVLNQVLPYVKKMLRPKGDDAGKTEAQTEATPETESAVTLQ